VNASTVRTIKNLVAAAALLVLSATLLAGPASAAGAPIKLGVYTAAQGQLGAPEDAAWLDNYAATVGRNPDIVMDYSNVTDPLLTQREISNLQARGETPLVTWQLFQSGYSGPTMSLDELAAGNYDSYLHKAAALAKTLPFEVMIRFGHEMNGDWYGWSGNPSGYVNAWRHVVGVFRQDGATNVKWVWSPNVEYNGSYPFASYFPGDSWVDYVALDGYNWGTAGQGPNRWESLNEVFASSYAKITQLSSKPVIIAETSSSEAGGNKAEWIRDGFLKTIPQKFPRVAAVLWFDRNAEEDWRINTSSAALAAYREVVASTLYGGNVAPAAETKEPQPVVEELEVTPVVPAAPSQGSAPKKKGHRAVHVRGKGSYRVSAGVSSVKLRIKGPGLSARMAKRTLTISNPKSHGTFQLSSLSGGRLLRDRRYRVVAVAIRGGSVSKPRRVPFRVAPQYGIDSASVAG
jgi:Glycosyl hydrolase family 26